MPKTVRMIELDPPGERAMLLELSETRIPEGLVELVSETVPAKPFRLDNVTVDVPVDPTLIGMDWTDKMLKSTTLTMTVVW